MEKLALGLKEQLAELDSAGLVRRLHEPEIAYAFKHALTQDTVYQSLLYKTRRNFHLRIAQAYERLAAEQPEDYVSVLALHYFEAGDDGKTFEFAPSAGDAAARVYANQEAIEQYTRAIEAGKRLIVNATERSESTSQQLGDLYSRRGRCFELTGQHDRALENTAEMEEFAREAGDRSLRLTALILRATIYSVHTPMHDPALGETISEQALVLARELGDRKAEARILWTLMLANEFGGGGADRARSFGEQSLEIARALDLREQMAYTLSDLGYAYLYVGQVGPARESRVEADSIWRQLDNKPMLADNLAGLANTDLMLGSLNEARRAAQESLAISRAIGNRWGEAYALASLSFPSSLVGDLSKAKSDLLMAIPLAEDAGAVGPLVVAYCSLAMVYLMVGSYERGFEQARLGAERARTQLPEWEPAPLAVLARIYLAQGKVGEAQAIIEACCQGTPEEFFGRLFGIAAATVFATQDEMAISQHDYARALALTDAQLGFLKKLSARTLLPETQYLRAQALLGIGEVDEADRLLHEAAKEAEALDLRPTLLQILITLIEMAANSGNSDEEEKLRRRANEVLDYIVEHISEPELQDSFLNQPRIRTLTKKETPGWR